MSANLDGTNVVNKMHDPNKDHNAREGDTLNIPIVTICWVTFFTLCFLIFLVLSLCSESHCACCRCIRCCREGTATVARIPSMVTTTYGSSRDSLHHSLMRPQTLANSQMASNSCGSLLTSNKNQQGGLGSVGNGNQNCSIGNNCSLNSTLIPNKGSEFYC